MHKKRIIMSVILLIVIGATVAFQLMNHGATVAAKIDSCPVVGPTRQLLIKDNHFVPQTLTVQRCDRIDIINEDHVLRNPALGAHENHIHYPGLSEKFITQGMDNSFIASTSGHYPVHDHLNDEVIGQIIIR